MGYDMAKYLSTYNFDLFLVAKDKKELDKKFKDLKNKIKTYGFDLSKEEECIKLYKEVRNENIDILINNAGFGDAGNFTETNLDKEMNMIDLNIKAYHNSYQTISKRFCQKRLWSHPKCCFHGGLHARTIHGYILCH